jgi:hypothetical protein
VTTIEMKQPGTQLAALQISAAPQLVPSVRPVHAEVLAPGWQTWHRLAGFATPAA